MIVAFYAEASCAGKDSCADFAAAWCRAGEIACERDAFAWDGKVVCADALGIQGTRLEKVAAIDRLKHHGRVHFRDYPIPEDRHATMFPAFSGQSGRDFIIGLLGDPDARTGIRGLDESFWTRQVIQRDQARGYDSITLVSDLRFLGEADMVYGSGGTIVEVVRPGAPRFNEQRVPAHQIDQTIRNDGTLEELQLWVETVMERVCCDHEVGGC